MTVSKDRWYLIRVKTNSPADNLLLAPNYLTNGEGLKQLVSATDSSPRRAIAKLVLASEVETDRNTVKLAKKLTPMNNMSRIFLLPANTFTKLEAVAIEIYTTSFPNSIESQKSLANTAVEAAKIILSHPDLAKDNPDNSSSYETLIQAKICSLIQQKGVSHQRITEIINDRYGVNSLCELIPEQVIDFATYLEHL